MKAAVDEHFEMKNGRATWKNRSEKGDQAISGKAFYLPMDAPPEFLAVLVRALLQAPNQKLSLLPAGEASLERGAELNTDGKLTAYHVTGLSFTPQTIWLGSDGGMATAGGWFSVVSTPYGAAIPQLRAAQEKMDADLSRRLAQDMTHIPKGELVIRNARLFDPRDLSVTPGRSVLVRGNRIIRIEADADLKPAADAEIIDAQGRFLMPGLWDNHQHFGGSEDGALDLANGVTSARDMGNDTDTFLKRVARFDDGSELGPRVLKAGLIDGNGEFAGPTKMRANTAAEAIKDVDWYAAHGYVQMKIYSSIKPELVPVIADRAHALGMRVSGHVPAFMSARQFIEGGADEIQHFNFIELNFLFPEVKETRNRDRFIKVAERAREFTPDKPAVREFINFLKQHHTVLDPTMNVFEGLFCGDPAAVTPGLEDIVPRFPAQVRRVMRSGALEAPADKVAAYKEAFPAMLRLLKAVYDSGVTIIPGTDELSGYTLGHELEIYVRAGIPPAEVLKMATLTPSIVMGVNKDRGVIAGGKLADMILVDGDPTKEIRDLRKITTVIKGGKVYDPVAIEKALGITPRATSQ
jgi:imidazolonepropionase-like amidohydrolase